MTDRVLEQGKAAITHVRVADKMMWHLLPSWQNIWVLESVSEALKPLQDFTDTLSGEEYVSVSCVKPALHLLNS